jgi:hypothetical protein
MIAGCSPRTRSSLNTTRISRSSRSADSVQLADDLRGELLLPELERRLEQRVPVGEVPVEAASGDAEIAGDRVDTDRFDAAGGQRPQCGARPILGGKPGP